MCAQGATEDDIEYAWKTIRKEAQELIEKLKIQVKFKDIITVLIYLFFEFRPCAVFYGQSFVKVPGDTSSHKSILFILISFD